MSPIDHRNLTFKDLCSRLVHLRQSVYDALSHHGPCTTRELAHESGLDLLTVRPRVTELVQLGFAQCLDVDGHEGRYRALTIAEAEALFIERQRQTEQQMDLAI